MKLMKSVIACLLLLMNLPHTAAAAFDMFTLPAVSDQRTPAKNFADREIGRVAVFKFTDPNPSLDYLMRVDPPEHCTRFIICSSEDSCTTDQSIIVLPHKGEIYSRTKDQAGAWDTLNVESDKTKRIDGNIKISVQKTPKEMKIVFKVIEFAQNKAGTAASEGVPNTVHLKEFIIPSHANYLLRVETSSFYCNVNIGKTVIFDEEIPDTSEYKTDSGFPQNFPFKFDDKLTTVTKHFGPLFFRSEGKISKNDGTEVQFDKFIEHKTSRCPFTHDHMGYAAWAPYDILNTKQYNGGLWKNPVYHYKLGQEGSSDCGKKPEKLFQIDIDIDEVINPTKATKAARCFGFALVFGDNQPTAFTFNPKRTFEFYLVSMMFLAPDKDQIRGLHVSREELRKIRISYFYNANEVVKAKAYAIVEYGFLNDRIAGIREFVALPDENPTTYKSVSLLTEGFCNVRLLNVNHFKKDPTDGAKREPSCWNIEGCDVLLFEPLP